MIFLANNSYLIIIGLPITGYNGPKKCWDRSENSDLEPKYKSTGNTSQLSKFLFFWTNYYLSEPDAYLFYWVPPYYLFFACFYRSNKSCMTFFHNNGFEFYANYLRTAIISFALVELSL